MISDLLRKPWGSSSRSGMTIVTSSTRTCVALTLVWLLLLTFSIFQYTDNKSYCEDLSEGKFSFPLIHGIKHDDSDRVINILRQRTEDVTVKKYCVDYLTGLGSLEYTKRELVKLDRTAREMIVELGGNEGLYKFLDDLGKVYRD